MATQDTCVTVVPYFKVYDAERLESPELAGSLRKVGDQAHCREGYRDASGVLAHLENVKLRGPLADFKPQFFILEYGFRR